MHHLLSLSGAALRAFSALNGIRVPWTGGADDLPRPFQTASIDTTWGPMLPLIADPTPIPGWGSCP
ncbi:hypothetical protein A3753_04850 [Sulfitobacter sp. HI0082]|nr:hypothetical protein A3753_04850 [Sulfitobacter sp. HI0082]